MTTQRPLRMRSVLATIRADERGSATVVLVIVLPALLTVILLIAQVGVSQHAAHIAQAAASEALAAARVHGGTAEAGQAQANLVFDQLGRGPLQDIHISVQRDDETASVTITGTASSAIPFVHLTIRADAAGRVERFRPDLDGGEG